MNVGYLMNHRSTGTSMIVSGRITRQNNRSVYRAILE